MKIHEDGVVVTTIPSSRKSVSFGKIETGRHSRRTPLREHNHRVPINSPYPNDTSGSKSTPFKSPSSTSKNTMTSNSFRQDLKKGCTPSSTKTKSRSTGERDKENKLLNRSLAPTGERQRTNRPQQQRHEFNLKPPSMTPSSASALRRTLRSTIQPRKDQQHQQQKLKIVSQQQNKSLRTFRSTNSSNQPFQSLTTAMSSSLIGRSRLLGKGGLAPGKTVRSGMGPPVRVAPKTPNTLLRAELEDEDDEFDESMLFSPPPGALWDALNLSSGGGGNKRHTMSPAVTTGLIMVSPQAAEHIHTWSSTKKRLSSPNSTPQAVHDKLSPPVPRALMQTPHAITTTSPAITPIVTAPSMGSITDSSLNNVAAKHEHETSTESIGTLTNEEINNLVKDERVLTIADMQCICTSSMKNTVLTQTNEVVLKSVQKSTKGGIAMDLTELFSTEDNMKLKKQQQSERQQKKKFVEKTPLSSSIPAAVLSRLNSKREITSKQVQNNGGKILSASSRATISKPKSTSTKTKLPTVRGSTTRVATGRNIERKSTMARMTNQKILPKHVTNHKEAAVQDTGGKCESDVMQHMTVLKKTAPTGNRQKVTDNDTVKPWQRQGIRKSNGVIQDVVEKDTVKPWKKKLTKKSSAAKNNASTITNERTLAKDIVKPWKRQQTVKLSYTNKKEKRKTTLTEASLDHQDTSARTKSNHRGGLAFDVDFANPAKPKTPLPSSSSQPRTKWNLSTTLATKDSKSTSDWADRQCEVFVGWLNYTLNPEEIDINNEGCIASGLRALIIHRRIAEGRVNAMKLFQGGSMNQIRTTILKEIARGRLSIRSDRDVAVDVQLRKKLVSLLLSYTTPWLRLALEAMFGEYIDPVPFSGRSPKTYLGRMKLALELFIKKRFLSDDSTLQKFTKGRCNVPSGAFETRYKEEMRNLVLSRIMTLVFFLDRAKEANVLENVPRLFTVSSNVKSTRNVLSTICRECLSAEGDIVKHLSRIGLKISYIQDPVDEVNFKVTNLATDLRDGILLTRLAEIITGASFKSNMSSLRLPVVSRLQKKFNVNLAFSTIKDFGIIIVEGINAHHIMDGHRDMVLALMWCVITHCCIEKVLQVAKVEQEIRNVFQLSQAREKMEGRVHTKLNRVTLNPSVSGPIGTYSSPEKTLEDILLRWSQAVCSSFGMTINDLSNSFANGKALCLLVHYYHPSLICVNEIFPASLESELDLNLEEVLEKEHINWRKASKSMQQLGGIPDMLPICDSKNPPHERSMILCLSYLCSRLMESSQEIFAAILIQACYRKYSKKVLMEKKIAATTTIFRIWTQYKDNYFRKQKQRYRVAVATLEDFVLSHKFALVRLKKVRLERKRVTRSVINIQRVFRGHLGRVYFDQLWELQLAAGLIQRTFRRYLAMRITANLSNKRDSAIVIQSAFRRFVAHEVFLHCRFVIIILQRNFRGHLARKALKEKEYAALVIQQAWWSYLADVESELAAIFVQKIWRGILGRRKCIEHTIRRDAACSIQKVWRGYYQSLVYFITLESSIVLQKTIRGFLVRKTVPLNRYRHAATSIQRIWRGFSVQVQFQLDLFDITCVQSLARRYLSRRAHKKRTYALSILQCSCRCFIARRRMVVTIKDRERKRLRYRSAAIIQAQTRRLIARRNIYFLQYSALVIQSHWRKLLWHRLSTSSSTKIQSTYRVWNCRRVFTHAKKAAVNIQRHWRGFASRQNNEILSFAAILIQSAWRRHWIYSDYTMYIKETKSATLIQAHVRGMATRSMIDFQNLLARTVQRQWQKYKQYRLETNAATMIQAIIRSNLRRSTFLEMKRATLVMQQMARVRKARHLFHIKQSERKCERAAVIMQSLWRGFSKQVQFQVDVMDIICVQSICRRYLVVRTYQRMTFATSIIQRAFRCAAARQERTTRKLSMDTLIMESSTKIQMIVRGYISRSRYLGDKYASVSIQKCWRGYLASMAYQRMIFATSIIQRAFRCAAARQERTTRKLSMDTLIMESSTKIQMIVRGYISRSRYLGDKYASVSIQKCWRGYLASMAYQRMIFATSIIQRAFRCAAARQERTTRKLSMDTLIMESSTKIQMIVRGYISRSKFLGDKHLSMIIQKCWRGHETRRNLRKLSQKSTIIQSTWRMYHLRASYLWYLYSAIKIQTFFRLHSTRSKFSAMKESVVCIQRHWRGIMTRDRFSKLSHAATKIQSHWRRSFAQNNYLLDLLEIKSATLIQASFRMYVRRLDYMVIKYSAHTIQRFTRGLLSRVDLAVKCFAASEIQRVWRGYCTYSSKTIILSLIKVQSVVRMVSAKKKVDELRILFWAERCNRNRNATVIQSSFRNYAERTRRDNAAKVLQNTYRFYLQQKRMQSASRGMIKLQSRFRGIRVRKKCSKRIGELARRIKEETRRAILEPSMRLGYRTSQALEILQTSQSLTKIMDAVKELEASTRLSVVCCQVFTKVNAANILLHLIQSCNRSVPHMELKEHILLTLENVAQHPSLIGSFAHYKYAEVFLDNVQVFRDKDGIFCLAVVLLNRIATADQDVAQFCATHEHLKRLKEVYRVVSRRRIKSKKNRAMSEKARRLRKYGLAKRDDFDREISTKMLGEMIEVFSKIEIPRATTPTNGKVFNFD